MSKTEEAFKCIVFDQKLMRPACTLLQAVFSGSPGIANRFPSEVWLTQITPDMKRYRVTEEQLKQLEDYFARHQST